MNNTSKINRYVSLAIFAAAFMLFGASLTEVSAQRDPFQKGAWAIPRKQPAAGAPRTGPATPPKPTYTVPPIESRIEYFKRLREAAVANGQELPRVTSVLTLSEMAVKGIFKTPRGWAAMVEATPIKLSYTIYPGEKFFDGQLVAVEENRLIFRKVTKVSDKKFVASVETIPLSSASTAATLQGTARSERPVQVAGTAPTDGKPASNPFMSPVDEMNNMPESADDDKDSKKKTPKRPVKMAKSGRN